MASLPKPTPLLDAALAYAARGWPVFPCSTKTKAPLLKKDVDPDTNKPIPNTGGVKKASTDRDQIIAWWTKWPKAAIGVATGLNGLFVVDFDPGTCEKTGKVYTLDGLKEALEDQIEAKLPASLSVRTAGKAGVHVYFRQPDAGADIRNRNNLPDRIDVRGTGGYVIVPPSRMDMVARQWDNLDKSIDTIERAVADGERDPRDLSAVRANARDRAGRNLQWQARQAFQPSAPSAPVGGGFATDNPSSFRSGTIGNDNAAGGEGEGEAEPLTASQRAKVAKALHARLSRHPRTDLGNAERFRDRFGDDFRFSPALGWLAWDGRRWKMLATEDKGIPGEVLAAVFKMVRAIRREAWIVKASGIYHAEDNPEGLDKEGYDDRGKPKLLSSLLFAWAEASESNARLRCVAGLVQPWLTVETDAFDRDPLTINVMNGTLRFWKKKGEAGQSNKAGWDLTPHRRKDLITRLCPVVFDRAAECANYDRVFAWAQPKPEVQRYLHQWGGLNLTGEMGEQILHFWHGGGGNAKSTIIDAWAHVGGDYATTVGIETFLDQGVKKSGGNPTPDLARLGGVRMLRTSEPEKGAQLAEALIKLVTGGEPMAVRFLNKGFFDLRPLYKLTISGNHWLGISGTDNGIWRRVKLIPWESRITEAEKDEALPEKLREEGSGIFNRLMLGLLDYLRHGMVEPAAVTAATAEYRDASDPLGRFLILSGESEDRETLVIVYAADPEDDWGDEATWRKANPNLGVSPKLDYIRAEYTKAKESPRLENAFKNFHLNLWSEQAVRCLRASRDRTAAPGAAAGRTARGDRHQRPV
jgi:putative DNA primase/helicase